MALKILSPHLENNVSMKAFSVCLDIESCQTSSIQSEDNIALGIIRKHHLYESIQKF